MKLREASFYGVMEATSPMDNVDLDEWNYLLHQLSCVENLNKYPYATYPFQDFLLRKTDKNPITVGLNKARKNGVKSVNPFGGIVFHPASPSPPTPQAQNSINQPPTQAAGPSPAPISVPGGTVQPQAAQQ